MQSNTKDRIKVIMGASILLIGLLFIGYIVFGKPMLTGEYTPMLKIVAVDNVEEVSECEKYGTPYAHRIKDGDNYILEYPNQGTYELTENQYNELKESDYYCFKIKFSKVNDSSSGTVKSVYTENPIQ